VSAKKKFGCDKCSKRFNRKDNLERHELTHQIAVYNCTLCGFNGNNRLYVLKKHLRSAKHKKKVRELAKSNNVSAASFKITIV